MKRIIIFLSILTVAVKLYATGDRFVRPFYVEKTAYSFNLEETQIVQCGNGQNYSLRWYRDTEDWNREDSTYSKLEISYNGSIVASFINEVGWVKFDKNTSSEPRIAETYLMNDSAIMLLLAGRVYSAGFPELCLIKLENETVTVVYNQEQAITSIQRNADNLIFSLDGPVIDCRNYVWNVPHTKLTDYNPTLKISKKEIVVEDGNGSKQVIYRNWLDYSTGELKYQLNPRNAEASVVGYIQGSVTYTIPSTISYQGITYNVVAIADSAFYGCQQLNRVTIPNTVRTIGSYAFTGTSLSMIFCSAQVPPVCGTYAFLRILLHNCRLSVPGESVDNYRNASPWNMFTFMDDLIR